MGRPIDIFHFITISSREYVEPTIQVEQASLDKSLGHDEMQWGHLAVCIMCTYVSFYAMKSVNNEQNPCIMTYVYEMNQLPQEQYYPYNNISWCDANIVIRVGRLYHIPTPCTNG